jgi:replication fork clamp-binding protein CrfC
LVQRSSKKKDVMTQPNDPRKVKVIVELIDHSSRIAATYDRGDLVERLGMAKERISDPQIRVVIAGQLKQGKSQLLNSLLNVPVARVGDDETTALATVVSYGEQASARLIVARGDGAEPDVVEIPPSEVQSDLRRAPQAGGREVLRVEVTAPTPPASAATASPTSRRRLACYPTRTRCSWSATPARSSPSPR